MTLSLTTLFVSSLLASASASALEDDKPAVSAPAAKDSSAAETGSIRFKSAEGRRLVAALGEIVRDQLSPLNKRRLGTKVMSESRVELARGRFPDAGTAVVLVNVNLRSKSPDDPAKFIGGILTLNADAGLATVAVPLQMRETRFELEAVTDVDGDGTDEIVYVARTQGGQSRHRVRWTAQGPKTTELPPEQPQ